MLLAWIVEHFLVHWYQQCITVHRVSRYMSCHRAIVVITGRARGFHDNMYITLILLLWDLSTLYIVDHLWPLVYMYVYMYICMCVYMYICIYVCICIYKCYKIEIKKFLCKRRTRQCYKVKKFYKTKNSPFKVCNINLCRRQFRHFPDVSFNSSLGNLYNHVYK